MDNPITSRRQPLWQGPRDEHIGLQMVRNGTELHALAVGWVRCKRGPDAGSYEGMKTYDEVD